MNKLLIFALLALAFSTTGCAPQTEQAKETVVQTEASGTTGEQAPELKPAPKAAGDNSAERAGMGDFDATGKIPCAQTVGQPTTRCDFGVARSGNGTATVVVTLPDGRKRTLFFTDGKLTGADTSQADGYGEARSEKEADLYFITVGSERYEIPEAIIYGG